MRRVAEVLVVLCVLGLCVTVVGCGGSGNPGTDAVAKGKPGGGGGGGGTPPGTIYFTSDGLTWTMDGDGNHKTALPAGVEGEPSHQIDGKPLWFLKITNKQLIAVDAMGTVEVPLLAQPDIEVRGSARWGPGDAVASCVGLNPDGSEGGVYAVHIAWDESGAVAPASAPTVRVSAAPVPYGGGYWPAIPSHDWSPSGRIAYSLTNPDGSAAGIWIVGAGEPLTPDGGDPNWSPDGSKIAFTASGGDNTNDIYVWNADGSGIVTVAQGKGHHIAESLQQYFRPRWSPTGDHLVCEWFRLTEGGGWQTADVYRFEADGGGKTNLTGDIDWGTPVAWR